MGIFQYRTDTEGPNEIIRKDKLADGPDLHAERSQKYKNYGVNFDSDLHSFGGVSYF
jgi:hypothetical protein